MGSVALKEKPFFASGWFAWVFLIGCLASALGACYLVVSSTSASVAAESQNWLDGGLYPLVLTGITTLLGYLEAPQSLQYIQIGFYAASILLTHGFISRRIRKPYSFLITALYAFSPPVMQAALRPADVAIPFLVFSLAALHALDSYIHHKGKTLTRGNLIWCLLWLTAAIYTHPAGLLLLAAFILVGLHKLGITRTLVAATVLSIFIVPWLFREALYKTIEQQNPAPFGEIQNDWGKQISDTPFDERKDFVPALLANMDESIQEATDTVLGTLRVPGGVYEGQLALSKIPYVRWAVGFLLAVGVSFGLCQFTGLGSLYLILFMALSWFFPLKDGLSFVWIAPVLLFYLFKGVMRIGEGFKRIHIPFSKVAAPLLTVLIGLNSLNMYLEAFNHTASASTQQNAVSAASRPASYPISRQTPASRWLRHNTPQNTRTIAASPALAEAAGRPVSRSYPQSSARSQVAQELIQADYVIEDRKNRNDATYLTPVLTSYRQFFRVSYHDPTSNIRIWKVVSP